MKSEHDLKMNLQQSLNQIAVPESLFQFADELPDRFDKGELESIDDTRSTFTSRPRRVRVNPILWRSAAAAVIMIMTFSAGIQMSPVFAAYMKEVPGFQLAVDWLTHLRERDGVQNAVSNGYSPIEPVTAQFGGTTVMINDIYLTDDELLFKAYTRSTEYDVTDGRSPVHFYVAPENLRGGGSTTGSAIAETTDGSKQPIRQDSYKYQLEENAVRDFFANGQKQLLLSVRKRTSNPELRSSELEQKGSIAITIDPNKLLHNKVLEPKQALSFEGADQEWKDLTLDKLTIQPTTMNAIISGKKGWYIDFPRDKGTAPYLKDDKGNVFLYDPSGPVLMLKEGHAQLPFSSSVFFDPGVRTIYLHIGELTVSEYEPSGSFEVSTKDPFPKTVHYKDRDIVIDGAEYHEEGYIHLKVRKERPDQKTLKGVAFRITDYEDKTSNNEQLINKVDELRLALNIDGFGTADLSDSGEFLSVYIPADKQEKYKISMQRANDTIVVNKDFAVPLKR